MRERLDFSSVSRIIRENMESDGLCDEKLREKYYLLFDQNALTQEIYFAQIQAADGKLQDAIRRV